MHGSLCAPTSRQICMPRLMRHTAHCEPFLRHCAALRPPSHLSCQVTFNTLIDVHGKMGNWEEAVGVLNVMKQEVRGRRDCPPQLSRSGSAPYLAPRFISSPALCLAQRAVWPSDEVLASCPGCSTALECLASAGELPLPPLLPCHIHTYSPPGCPPPLSLRRACSPCCGRELPGGCGAVCV